MDHGWTKYGQIPKLYKTAMEGMQKGKQIKLLWMRN